MVLSVSNKPALTAHSSAQAWIMIMICNDDNDDDAMMAMMVIRSAESWQRADVIKHLALTAPHLPEQLLDGIIIVFMFITMFIVIIIIIFPSPLF